MAKSNYKNCNYKKLFLRRIPWLNFVFSAPLKVPALTGGCCVTKGACFQLIYNVSGECHVTFIVK